MKLKRIGTNVHIMTVEGREVVTEQVIPVIRMPEFITALLEVSQ